MAKLDISGIQNFDSMTDAEKVTALLGLEVPDVVDLTGYVKKSVFDAKATEAANLSKQLKAKLTDDESAELERQRVLNETNQKYTDLESRYNELVKKSTVAEYTTKYIELGYEKSLAESTAKAMADGDMETVFSNGEKHRAALEKKIKEDLINQTPKPSGNIGGNDGNNKDSAGIEQAKKIGQERANVNKNAADVLKNYI